MIKFSWPEDSPALKLLLPILKVAMGASLPGLRTEDEFARLQRVDMNNVESEFWILVSAFAWGYTTNFSPAPYASALLNIVVFARVFHNLCLLFHWMPLRTFAFLPGVLSTLFMGVQAVLHAK